MKKRPKEIPRYYLKGQIPLANIRFNKGKYPQSSEEPLDFSTVSDISYISQVYSDN